MKKNGKKHFSDQGKLEQVMHLRRHGASYEFVAFLFDCDKSSIIRQCQKWGITAYQEVYYPPRIAREVIHSLYTPKRIVINGINQGKTYQEYLKEQKERQSVDMHLYGHPRSGTIH